jgi:hypothetical protein
MCAGGAVLMVESLSSLVGHLQVAMASAEHGFKTGSASSLISDFAAVCLVHGTRIFLIRLFDLVLRKDTV